MVNNPPAFPRTVARKAAGRRGSRGRGFRTSNPEFSFGHACRHALLVSLTFHGKSRAYTLAAEAFMNNAVESGRRILTDRTCLNYQPMCSPAASAAPVAVFRCARSHRLSTAADCPGDEFSETCSCCLPTDPAAVVRLRIFTPIQRFVCDIRTGDILRVGQPG